MPQVIDGSHRGAAGLMPQPDHVVLGAGDPDRQVFFFISLVAYNTFIACVRPVAEGVEVDRDADPVSPTNRDGRGPSLT